MSRSTMRLTKLRTLTAAVLAAACTASLGLYVLHEHAVGRAADTSTHTAGSISLERAASDHSPAPIIELSAGSYHSSAVLTDCGSISWSLTTGVKDGAPPDQQVIVGRDSMGDPLAPESVVNGYHIDPKTGMAPHHTTPYEVDFAVTQTRQFRLQDLDIEVYNNAQCSIQLTIRKQ